MLIPRGFLVAILLIGGVMVLPARSIAADTEATEKVVEGVRWVGPAPSLEILRGKTVVLIDYATWCPKCNAWSGEVCKQVTEAIRDKPVVVLAVNNDDKPGNVRPYLEARGFFAPNIVHGYDRDIAKRNGLPDLWGYMVIDPEGKITTKGQLGSYFGGEGNKEFVLPKLLREHDSLGEFIVLDPKMSDAAKNAIWPVELGQPVGAELRKLSSEVKEQVKAGLNKYGEKEVAKARKLAEGDVAGQFAAYDRANALSVRLKYTDAAKGAKLLALELESKADFKRELGARKAYQKCETLPANSRALSTALRNIVKRFDGTVYAAKAQEAVAALSPPTKAKS